MRRQRKLSSTYGFTAYSRNAIGKTLVSGATLLQSGACAANAEIRTRGGNQAFRAFMLFAGR